jgi:hypothetical protein
MILERLARIEEKLDNAANHEGRIRKLEQWRSGVAVGVAIIFAELQILALFLAQKHHL